MANTEKIRGDLLEVKDICALCHVQRRTVYRWMADGKIRGMRAGRKWLFTREAVNNLLKG